MRLPLLSVAITTALSSRAAGPACGSHSGGSYAGAGDADAGGARADGRTTRRPRARPIAGPHGARRAPRRTAAGSAPTSRSPSRGSSSCCSSPRCPSMVLAAGGLPDWWVARGDDGRRHARGRQRERAQLLPRPRHRRDHAAHRRAARWPGTRSRRPARWSSAWSSASSSVLAIGARHELAGRRPHPRRHRASTSSSTRCCSSAAPSQNIVWGGAAGCMPVLIGWTAVTGSLAVGAVRAVRGGVLLDAAAHLGAGHPLPRGLRAGRRADAAGGRDRRRASRATSSSTPG